MIKVTINAQFKNISNVIFCLKYYHSICSAKQGYANIISLFVTYSLWRVRVPNSCRYTLDLFSYSSFDPFACPSIYASVGSVIHCSFVCLSTQSHTHSFMDLSIRVPDYLAICSLFQIHIDLLAWPSFCARVSFSHCTPAH